MPLHVRQGGRCKERPDPSPSTGEGQKFEKGTGTMLRKLKVQSLKEELWRERLFLEETWASYRDGRSGCTLKTRGVT